MTVEIQTLKQAAQALRNTRNPHVLDLVAALEAMAEMQPVAWMATRLHSVVIAAKREDLFAFGQQQHISPLYAAPITTPEHDAKVRDAALDAAIAALRTQPAAATVPGGELPPVPSSTTVCAYGYDADDMQACGRKCWDAARAALAAPAAPQEQPSDERLTASEQRMLHDFPHLMDFYQKHALGPMRAPSCLRCGKSMQGEKPALKHLELPGIVICADCMAPSAAPQAGEDARPVAFAKEGNLFWHGDHVGWREWSGNLYLTPQPAPQAAPAEELAAARQEIERLNSIINTPQADDFLRAVSTEAEHQRQRWGSEHDAGKAPADWFWLLGYLGGKALHAHSNGNTEKAEHHIITTAAVCANWHRAMFGKTDMRPGIDGEAALTTQGASQ